MFCLAWLSQYAFAIWGGDLKLVGVPCLYLPAFVTFMADPDQPGEGKGQRSHEEDRVSTGGPSTLWGEVCASWFMVVWCFHTSDR